MHDSERPTLGPRVAAGAGGVALAAAVLVPGVRAGAGLSAAALILVVFGAAQCGRARLREPWRLGLLLGAGVLALTPLLRDAGWLVAIDLALTLGLTAVALGDATRFATVWRALAAFTAAVIPAPAAVIRGVRLPSPRTAGASAKPVLRGVAIAACLLIVFGALFASADGAFAELLDRLAPDTSLADGLPARVGVALLAGALAGALALAPSLNRAPATIAPPSRRLEATEWGIALGAVVALFAAFVAVQFVVLFGGREHVLETAGLTYAEYARQGFGQLLVVAGLAIALVAAAWRWAHPGGRGQELGLRLLLAAICALTVVILIAALHRLDLYVDAFGATRLRVIAVAACVWVGGVVAFILAAIASASREWLPQAVVLFTAGLSVAFMVADPEARIAERNVERFESTGKFDTAYNATLGADATLALTGLPAPLEQLVLARERARLSEPDGPLGFSFARDRARAALD